MTAEAAMKRRNPRLAVTYIGATLAALACLYGCAEVPYGATEAPNAVRHANTATDGHSSVTAPAGSQAAAAAAAHQVLSGLVVPAGARLLPERPAPAGLSAPAEALSAGRSVDVYRLYRVPLPAEAAAAFLRSHLPAGLVAGGAGQPGAGQPGTVDSASATLVVSAAPRRLPAGIYAMEFVDTIVRVGSGSSLLRADVQVIWYPARSGAEEGLPGPYRSVRLTVTGSGERPVISTSRSVIGTIEALLGKLPAAPALIRSCPAITLIYELTLEPARTGQPAVVITTGGCEVDDVSVGGREQPALWDQEDRVLVIAQSLLRPRVEVGWPMFRLQRCRTPVMQTATGSVPCAGKPKLAPRIPD
jgi:hypothetical protein